MWTTWVCDACVPLSSLVQLIAGDRSGCETTGSDPAIGEVEAKEALWVTESLWGCDRITQVLDDIENLGLFRSTNLLERVSDLQSVLLGVFRCICLAEHQLTFTIGGLVELNERDKNGQPDSNEPALACTACHWFQLEARQELHLDQDGQVIKEPIEQEGQSGQDLQVLFKVRQFALLEVPDLHPLVEWLEQTEQLSRSAHVLCNINLSVSNFQSKSSYLPKRPLNALCTSWFFPSAWYLMNLEPYWIILQNLSRPSTPHQHLVSLSISSDHRRVDSCPKQFTPGLVLSIRLFIVVSD